MEDEVSALLLKARDYMDKHGKATRTFEDNLGQVCMIGAMRRVRHQMIYCPAEGFDETYYAASSRLQRYIRNYTSFPSTVDFSDASTKKECLAMFTDAAKS